MQRQISDATLTEDEFALWRSNSGAAGDSLFYPPERPVGIGCPSLESNAPD